ncbi:DUF3466 family protein [Vibrio alginolyticus]|uniref:DUF3466 family protein n=1 Tax=Vibrio alginolyticus TaxID=663 RepID=UPI001BD5E018|nr:DUF3466 family protein [Vibrio alginolyticus]MBS9896877.1 DUF3466 family protein [Vibrio alginolyticus]
MNCSNKFKLTAVAMMVGTAMNANAALYKVVEVTPNDIDTTDKAVFGVAIERGDVAFDKGCFDNGADCITSDQFALAGETRPTLLADGSKLPSLLAGVSVDGVNFREETPFSSDSRFRSFEKRDYLEDFCFSEYGYETCESWASSVWAPLHQVRYSSNTDSVSLAFVEGQSFDNQYNSVINTLIEGAIPVGNQSVLNSASNSTEDKVETDNQPFSPSLPPNYEKLDENDERTDYAQVRAWNYHNNLTSGSVAYARSNDYGLNYVSKAAIWDDSGDVSVVEWESGQPNENEHLSQGSIRDFVVSKDDNGNIKEIYAVGFNTWDNDRNQLNATVFKGSFDAIGDPLSKIKWDLSAVSGARSYDGSDYIYSNTVIEAINNNKLAVGEAKRTTPESGAQANRLYVIKDIDSPSADFLSGGIFFSGAGGHIGGLNDYNEIVGQIDAENTREDGGKARRKRAFIEPYEFEGTIASRREVFKNQAWLLDDLTNGGDYNEENNRFRIVDATDINNAGVISATAIMCENGYDTTAHNALCNGGNANSEKVVAVKLIPIPGATKDMIEPRSVEQTAAERQGAGLGWLALTMLGLFGFRRK